MTIIITPEAIITFDLIVLGGIALGFLGVAVSGCLIDICERWKRG